MVSDRLSIPEIDQTAPISVQIEQHEQLNIFLLQDIDKNFSDFHQIITTRVIPAVKKFNEVSEPTREYAKFWRNFFEMAAQARVPDGTEPDPADVTAHQPYAHPSASTDHTSSPSANHSSLRHPDASSYSSVGVSTPSAPSSHMTSDSSFLAGLGAAVGSSTPNIGPTSTSSHHPHPSRGGFGLRAESEEPEESGSFLSPSMMSDLIMPPPHEVLTRKAEADIQADHDDSLQVENGVDRRGSSEPGRGIQRVGGGRNYLSQEAGANAALAASAAAALAPSYTRHDDAYDSDQDSPDASFTTAYRGDNREPGNVSRLGQDSTFTPSFAELSIHGPPHPSNPFHQNKEHPNPRYSSVASETQPVPKIPASMRSSGTNSKNRSEPDFVPSGTPRRPSATNKWNGLTDLRSTPLSAAKKPSYHRQSTPLDSDSDDSLDELPPGMSPPVTMNFTMSNTLRGNSWGGVGGATGMLVPSPVKQAVGSVVRGLLHSERNGGRNMTANSFQGMPTPPRPSWREASSNRPSNLGRPPIFSDGDQDRSRSTGIDSSISRTGGQIDFGSSAKSTFQDSQQDRPRDFQVSNNQISNQSHGQPHRNLGLVSFDSPTAGTHIYNSKGAASGGESFEHQIVDQANASFGSSDSDSDSDDDDDDDDNDEKTSIPGGSYQASLSSASYHSLQQQHQQQQQHISYAQLPPRQYAPVEHISQVSSSQTRDQLDYSDDSDDSFKIDRPLRQPSYHISASSSTSNPGIFPLTSSSSSTRSAVGSASTTRSYEHVRSSHQSQGSLSGRQYDYVRPPAEDPFQPMSSGQHNLAQDRYDSSLISHRDDQGDTWESTIQRGGDPIERTRTDTTQTLFGTGNGGIGPSGSGGGVGGVQGVGQGLDIQRNQQWGLYGPDEMMTFNG
ncbi:dash complex subunit ask1 [Phaffia rhodozyma]|uniref:DASH complex subunit ASK1 n=1 Tax=Phaffia rhodozyma TaxID=264483 RepID=A0A0F7SYN2_PHARH|nr:dash complex subunit ask1 [Phaffia rhodozyma]